MQMSALAEIMKKSGIVGAGGAGFPSYAKLNEKADTVILNCAECEPLFRLHRQLLAKYASEILSALDMVRDSVGASQAIIAIKPTYTEAIEEIEARLDIYKNIKVAKLPEIYPAGDEIITIYETTGRIVKPGKLPITEGVIVYNVETILNVYRAVNDSEAVCFKYITVAGEVKNPITIRVPLGMTFGDAIKLAGGETEKDCTIISGGVMTGNIAKRTDVVTKTTNAVLVLPQNHPVIMKKKTNTKINIYRAMSACCQCRMCTDLCSRNLLGYPIEPHSVMRAAAKGMTKDIDAMINTAYCSQCRICEMYACQQGLSPANLIAAFKADLRRHRVTLPENATFIGLDEAREYKKIPMERLISRLGIAKYDVEAPFIDADIKLKELKIMLSQHIGQPAAPLCKKGDTVEAMQTLASCEGLGADIHAPYSGKVKEVTDKYILIDIKR